MLCDIHKENISKKYSSNDRFNWILANVKKVIIKMLEKWGCHGKLDLLKLLKTDLNSCQTYTEAI